MAKRTSVIGATPLAAAILTIEVLRNQNITHNVYAAHNSNTDCHICSYIPKFDPSLFGFDPPLTIHLSSLIY
jgi:hypothetical protein